MRQSGLNQSIETRDFPLTRMELTSLTLVANGFRPAEICIQLNLSEKEIEILLCCAERKLGAKNRLHAIGIAVGQGMIGIEV